MSSSVKFESIIPDEFSVSFALSLTHTTLSSPQGLGLFPYLVYPPNGEPIWKKRIVCCLFLIFFLFSMCSAIRERNSPKCVNVCWGIKSSFSLVFLTAQWLDFSGIDSQR